MDLTIDQSEVAELEKAFHLMWETFPDPVTLVHKSKTVVAINVACQKFGGEKGMNCAKRGTPENHKGCLANEALNAQGAAWRAWNYCERNIFSYWLPVPEHPEYFVHFSVGSTTDYNKVPEMNPNKDCEQ